MFFQVFKHDLQILGKENEHVVIVGARIVMQVCLVC
jgi:hypothetical protein